MKARTLALGLSAAAFVALLQLMGAGSALAGSGGDPGSQAKTTPSTVAKANRDATQACRKSSADASERDKAAANLAKAQANPRSTPAQIAKLQADLTAKTTTAAASAAACAAAQANAVKEQTSLAGISRGPTTDAGTSSLPDVHNTDANVVKSDNMTWISNSKGTNGNFAGANFIHYENLGYDFMFGDGTGGLSVWSLKDPAHPLYISNVPAASLMQPADPTHGVQPAGLPADTQARFYEGENITVDSHRKLVFMARDPRSFGNNNHPNGRTGLYIVDVKDPWHPHIVTYQWVPAGHTATCINDCRYIWSMGPANNGSKVNGQPQDIAGVLHPEWTGVPVFVTDVRDPVHPYTYAQPVDMFRNNNHTDYTHSADVDQNGIVWTSGSGGVRGFYTSGKHHDVTTNTDRYASAINPIPYAGGTVPSVDLVNQFDHNAYHVTQANTDHSSRTVTAASGEVFNKADLVYVTEENTISCTSTSGGGSGHFVVVDLAGSYGGQDWASSTTTDNKFFLRKIGDYSAKNNPGSLASAGCSAHWFTVLGNMVAISFYGQGTRILDMSDPTNPTQVGYIRIPSQTAPNPSVGATNASATYWHNGYLYVADYTRGIDVEKFTGEIKGVIQPKVCWNVCDK